MLITVKPHKLSSCYVATLFLARTTNVVSKSLKIEYLLILSAYPEGLITIQQRLECGCNLLFLIIKLKSHSVAVTSLKKNSALLISVKL